MRASTTSCQPSAARLRARASPRPRDAPVMRAVRVSVSCPRRYGSRPPGHIGRRTGSDRDDGLGREAEKQAETQEPHRNRWGSSGKRVSGKRQREDQEISAGSGDRPRGRGAGRPWWRRRRGGAGCWPWPDRRRRSRSGTRAWRGRRRRTGRRSMSTRSRSERTSAESNMPWSRLRSSSTAALASKLAAVAMSTVVVVVSMAIPSPQRPCPGCRGGIGTDHRQT